MGHIVEGSNNAVHESPAFEVWKDSKWCEFYQYDLYVALGLRHDADRVYEKWYQQVDDFPRPRLDGLQFAKPSDPSVYTSQQSLVSAG
jgi:hypothetical protein